MGRCSLIRSKDVLHAVALIAFLQAPSGAQTPGSSYEEGLKPILAKSCSGCHTFGGHAGGLRLDSYESALKGGDRGPAVVPGEPQNSLLVKAVHYEDADLKMPPRGKLADTDIAAIEAWIKTATSATSSPSSVKPAVQAPAKSTAPAAEPPSEPAPVVDAKISPEEEQFFEAQIRPLLTKNCYACHTNLSSGGLRLDSREAMLKGGKDGVVVVPGHPESSLLVSAIHYGAKLQMPPSGPLKPGDVAVIETWIRDGAKWPATTPVTPLPKVTEAQRNFWSFRAPSRPAVPAVTSSWAHNDIDRLILAKLDEQHLKPVADADKRTLIRRVTYDLTGLPPTPAEVQSFLDDQSSDAYEHLVDRLLASKAYGERWGRMWLDVVRYADTSGGGGDYPVPQAYKYRDYVIQSFVDDKPYDRFIREQIAGDLLPAQSESEHWQNLIATGYLAGTNRADGKQIFVADAVDNLGSAFLGVTLGCARCHDHKFDPIPTADYYAIYGILASTHYPESGTDEVRFQRGFVYRDPEALNREDSKIFQAQLKPVQDAIEAVLKLPGTYDDLIPQLQARRMHLFEHMPDLGESAYAVTEGDPEDAKIQHYGDPRDLGEKVPRGFLQVLGGSALPPDARGSGRLELANWIASKDNPLTARVIVNRIWQGHFGHGIVSTANDFGTRGVAPSNQALLDHLAFTLMDSGWSLKALHKEILLSHAYTLSSADSPANEEIDPDNAYIWRHSRSRLDAEEIRDSLLSVSGLLDRSPAGPHPFPPQAEWNWEDQNHFAPEPVKYETDRRTVYTMVQRTVRLPYFTLFDGPNNNVSTEQRSNSLTPLQALYFMNADFPRRCATNLASLLLATGSSENDVIQQAFLTVYGRPPLPAESDRAAAFLHKTADVYATHGVKTPVQPVALEELLKALFASNEFMFVE
jgi:mono/diheme cytochrome c family protein